MCGVSDGDAPIRLQWLKDGIPIHGTGNSSDSSGSPTNSQFSDMSTHQMSAFGVLALQIPHVTWNDTGNYSCVAHNAAGHASLTLQLIVHGNHTTTLKCTTFHFKMHLVSYSFLVFIASFRFHGLAFLLFNSFIASPIQNENIKPLSSLSTKMTTIPPPSI